MPSLNKESWTSRFFLMVDSMKGSSAVIYVTLWYLALHEFQAELRDALNIPKMIYERANQKPEQV